MVNNKSRGVLIPGFYTKKKAQLSLCFFGGSYGLEPVTLCL